MKKFKALKLLTLLFATFSLVACGGGDTPSGTSTSAGGSTTSQTSDQSVNPDGTVNVYLVVTEGKIDGKAGESFEDLFIENAFKITVQPGADLPGADKVTSNTGATFLGWMTYEGQGAPTQYTKAPSVNNVILYANFQVGSGGQGGGGGGEIDPPAPEGATTFTWTVDWVWNDGVAVIAWVWGGSHGDGEFVDCTKISDTSVSVVLGDGTGCCFGRFPAGTTAATADWANKYNQSENADMTNHTVAW